MLVISRKVGESLIIGDGVTIKILSLGSDKISVGIDAPRHVPIVRAELLEVIRENKEASKAEIRPEALAPLLKKGKAGPEHAK